MASASQADFGGSDSRRLLHFDTRIKSVLLLPLRVSFSMQIALLFAKFCLNKLKAQSLKRLRYFIKLLHPTLYSLPKSQLLLEYKCTLMPYRARQKTVFSR